MRIGQGVFTITTKNILTYTAIRLCAKFIIIGNGVNAKETHKTATILKLVGNKNNTLTSLHPCTTLF